MGKELHTKTTRQRKQKIGPYTEKAASKNVAVVKPVKIERMKVTIRNREGSPISFHNWDPISIDDMRRKHILGEKGSAAKRRLKDPFGQFLSCFHLSEDGHIAIPAGAIRKSIVNAAHKDQGLPGTTVRKAIFVVTDDIDNKIPIRCSEPVFREDVVRLSSGAPDLRYRPLVYHWEADITIEYDTRWLTPKLILDLIMAAGFGVGLHENRPERNGDGTWGRYEIKPTNAKSHPGLEYRKLPEYAPWYPEHWTAEDIKKREKILGSGEEEEAA